MAHPSYGYSLTTQPKVEYCSLTTKPNRSVVRLPNQKFSAVVWKPNPKFSTVVGLPDIKINSVVRLPNPKFSTVVWLPNPEFKTMGAGDTFLRIQNLFMFLRASENLKCFEPGLNDGIFQKKFQNILFRSKIMGKNTLYYLESFNIEPSPISPIQVLDILQT